MSTFSTVQSSATSAGGIDRRAAFSWEAARDWVEGLPGDRGVNLAHEAVDRHASGPLADSVALRFLGKKGERTELTYAELARVTARFASGLVELGMHPGDRLFTLLGRVPELHLSVLGALKAGMVASPLFSAFGPEPIRQRMELGEGRVLVTTASLYRRKVAPVRDELTHLELVVVVGDAELDAPGAVRFDDVVARGRDDFEIPATEPDALALLHFTSGTTGTPKGARHVHEAVVGHHATGELVLDLAPGTTYWCTADPGWVTGTSYGIVAPLTCGATAVVDEGEFDAERWYTILERERVEVWYTAPTAIRMLMRAGAEAAAPHDLSALRLIVSVGEPLHPEAVRWGGEVLGVPIHDSWWQTETGAIMVATVPGDPLRPGSMGRPLPGIETALLARDALGDVVHDDDGMLVYVTEPDAEGELAIRPGWPSMFRGYLAGEERSRKTFVDGWYRTGDLVRRDADGWLWFVGRGDDVIKSAGHLIGPFEVEQILLEHPAVVEAGVIGVPDDVAGEVVKAFVTLAAGIEETEQLRLDILGFARSRLGPAVAPRAIVVDPHLPVTRSGKIMRRVLKARELGLPEGDLSTMEERR